MSEETRNDNVCCYLVDGDPAVGRWIGRDSHSQGPLASLVLRADTVGRYFGELLSEGRLELIDERMAPDVVLHLPNRPEPIRGREGVRQLVTELRACFPGARFSIERRIAVGNKVVARWHLEGTHPRLKEQGPDVFIFEGDKLAGIWMNARFTHAPEQAGRKAPPRARRARPSLP
ncbi:ester cyclase [Pyxidicoccus caerfyrddinensis]|uniref:ester cyclase n=1 Tax=Pyxidicoccus caerfyrddinensis TaxID=2709663 RepID=UPI0013DD17AE|nr:nuclear transport factor 2 family protein [Pyxidicoccus caerfyrddinensis]